LHSRDVINEIEELETDLRGAGLGVMGYILTARPDYLAIDRKDMADIRERVVRLRALARDEPDQLEQVDKLEDAVQRWVEVLRRRVRVRDEQGFEAARDLISNMRDRSVLTDVVKLVRELEDKEKVRLDQRMKETMKRLRWGIASFAIAFVLALVNLVA